MSESRVIDIPYKETVTGEVLDAAPAESEAYVDKGSNNGQVAVKARDVNLIVGTGDITNDKSTAANMNVSGGTVNITTNNTNTKTVSKASRFDKLPPAPEIKSIEDKFCSPEM